MVNGGHKNNVWEIMRCPEYVLKCDKSVHLPARVSFLCLLGDLWVICAASALGDFPLIETIIEAIIETYPERSQRKSRSNHPQDR